MTFIRVSTFFKNRLKLSLLPGRNFTRNFSEIINGENTNDVSPALYALDARLNLRFSDPKLLLQVVTLETFGDTKLHSGEGYRVLGNHALGLYVTEYLHVRYPLIPLSCLQKALTGYCGSPSLAAFGQEVGVQHVIRWKPTSDEDLFKNSKSVNHTNTIKNKSDGTIKSFKATRTNIDTAVAESVRAIIGALYIDKGPQSAKRFIHDYILSRDIDMQDVIQINDVKRELHALMRRKNRESPIARLKGESGAHSVAPVFVVGVYSGVDELGEGFGSSKKMAEFRAFRDALMKYYLSEVKDYTLPSAINTPEKQDSYIPTKVGDTPPKI
ncbi:11053_t:CDS:2 [Acaulospora colombiana]|uniref:11053_t:CDS:1 n=1 Tax=Acaulospora colombiana TaxID=27376 RepID=A0ACA9KK73_9GLOM|nr:11053_t:CDS:2 [Acaulospora colombiana]